ncbi:MAG: dCMP deaminase family protein [Acidobacteria bacterium]|nr:dCMP deaminase family protein [Acidobacteriota bacterium]MCI0721443.1 dCMP deaminase family protein [Acidobacteriota bacterium]
MIVALCGEALPLKARLIEHLAEKSFYLRAGEEFDGLEPDKNYVINLSGSDSNLQRWRDRKAMIIWVGSNGQASSGAERVIVHETPEAEALESLNQWVLAAMRQQERPGWHEYFMKIAQVASMRSNCIKRKVGAVIVRDRRIVSTGYNGTPRGTKNCNEGGCPRCNSLASSGTRLDECLCSHAEENAITQAAYHGTSVKEGTIYTTFAPCLMCSKMIINSGVIEVIFNVDYPLNDTSFHLFEQAGVKIRQHRLD